MRTVPGTQDAGLPLARRRRWSTWASTHTCRPRAWVAASSVPEVRAAVALAARAGDTLRPGGSGRSGAALAMTEGILLDMRAMNRVLSLDRDAREVVAEPGITLRDLSRRLAADGLALETVGECDHVTLGGAVTTAMHASGAAFGSISSRVRELELVLPDGSLVTASPTSNARLYAAARVGLGAFGVLTRVRLAVVPAFGLHVQQQAVDLAEAVASVEWLVAEHDHVDLTWVPHSGHAVLRTMDREPPAGAGGPRERLSRWREDAAASLIAHAGARGGATWEAMGRAVGTRVRHHGPAPGSFVRPHPVRYRDSEYAVHRSSLGELVRRLQLALGQPGRRRGLVVRIRFGAPEDAWLAPTHARHSAYVGVRVAHGGDEGGSFAALGDAALALEGRPSWAGSHGLDAATLASLYPRFRDALAVRDEVDPTRMLTNGYLARVLGA